MVQTVEISIPVPQLKQNYHMIWQLHFCIYIYLKESWDSSRYLYIYVCNNIIHNIQKVEATQASPDG